MSYITPARRLNRLPAQLFARLVAITKALQAEGHDVINLGQGNPDLPTPDHVVEAVRRAAGDIATPFRVALDPETEFCILTGAKLGRQEISLCLLNEGDICLMPDPCYPDYGSGVALAGASPYPSRSRQRTAFSPT